MKSADFNILFISNEATRTGAPLLLLDFMKWIKEKQNIKIYLNLLKGGELTEEFKKVSEKIFTKKLGLKEKLLNNFTRKVPFDIIFGNTVLSVDELLNIKNRFPAAKTILFVHETDYFINILFSEKEGFAKKLEKIDKIIAVSEAVKGSLVNNYAVHPEKIEIIFPWIASAQAQKNANTIARKGDEKILVFVGYPLLVKGFDLLPQIAFHLRKKFPDFKFRILVVGNMIKNDILNTFLFDIRKLNIEDCFEFLGSVQNVREILNTSDLLLMTSRQESFSLVTAEAILEDTAALAFKNVGGPNEILMNDEYFMAEYLDTAMFAEKIYCLLNDEQILKLKKAGVKENFNKKFNVQNQEKLFEQISLVLKNQ